LASEDNRNRSFPILGVLAGIIFIIAGLVAYLHIETGLSIAIIFIIAGAAVILVGFAGLRTQGWHIALFVIGLIILAGVVSSNYYQTTTPTIYSYSATRALVSASRINITATTSFGSIDLKFSNNPDVAYQVKFETGFSFPFVFPGNSHTLTNETRDGVFILTATSSAASITITLGSGYETNINATANTGSISVNIPSSSGANVRSISLVTSTGSVDAQMDGQNISGILLKSSTGSVNFGSNYLSPSSTRVPISISSSTGSVNINMKIADNAAVGIDASNNFGSISQHLPGFTISQNSNNHLVAYAGDINATEKSFLVAASVSTGSINVDCELVSPQ